MRRNKVEYKNVSFTDSIKLDRISGRRIDLEITVRAVDGEELFRRFAVRFAQDEQYYTSFSFKAYESVLKIDRKFSGSTRAIVHQRRSKVAWSKKKLKFRIILDRFSAEIFVNDGQQVFTTTIYTDQSAEGITFLADGKVNMDVTKYDLISWSERSDSKWNHLI